MKKLFLVFLALSLLASCGVSNKDIADACATISSPYIDSQLRMGKWKADPRFNNILNELKRKKNRNHENDPSYYDIDNMVSDLIYTNIALGALNKNENNPKFFSSCVEILSERFEVL
tara:strand:- start:662 stop:1012 length:351 start_codon:yes stop_codon:yes gene_type:complete